MAGPPEPTWRAPYALLPDLLRLSILARCIELRSQIRTKFNRKRAESTQTNSSLKH